MARANTSTEMDLCMMDSGRTGTGAERESLLTVMEMYMKQSGQVTIHQNQELFKGTGDFGQAQRKIFTMENKIIVILSKGRMTLFSSSDPIKC